MCDVGGFAMGFVWITVVKSPYHKLRGPTPYAIVPSPSTSLRGGCAPQLLLRDRGLVAGAEDAVHGIGRGLRAVIVVDL